MRYACGALSSRTTIRGVLIPVTEEDRLEVQQELERILASTPFKGSRRYPALLRHVVEKTLRGRGRRGEVVWYRGILNQEEKVVQEGEVVTLIECRPLPKPVAGEAAAEVTPHTQGVALS